MEWVSVTPLAAARANYERLVRQANTMGVAPVDARNIMRALLSTAEAVVAREQLLVDETAAEKRQPYYGKTPY
jgi:hypothetical protein